MTNQSLVMASMAAVRDGKPAEAESLLNEALKIVDYDPNRRIMALAYHTLARARLGKMEEPGSISRNWRTYGPRYWFPPQVQPSSSSLIFWRCALLTRRLKRY